MSWTIRGKTSIACALLAVALALVSFFALKPVSAYADEGSAHFPDVEQDAWYNEVVGYAYENGILLGMDDGLFRPEAGTTRGMLVTVLHRFEGEPEPDAECSFPDVDQDEYYANAVAWGEETGVVAGYDDGTFGPDDVLTREQIATFLLRYAEYKNYDTTGRADLSSFPDEDEISDFAYESLEWANDAALITGFDDDGTLRPLAGATRAEFAAIMSRFHENLLIATFTVTFDLGYGSDSTHADVSVDNGEAVAEPSEPTRSGYTFLGWYTQKTGGSKYDFSKPVTADLTVFAHWSKNTPSVPSQPTVHTVTFDTDGGSEVPNQSIEAGECAVQPDNPTKDGFTFAGWFSDADLTEAYDFSTPVYADFTLYAKWEATAGDDLGDDESTEVTEDDQFKLSVDRPEVSMSSGDTEVVFKVSSTLTIGTVELYLNGEPTGVQLYDDGGYDSGTSIDDIPNDGVYTAEYAIYSESDADLVFDARATVGETSIKSNEVTVFAYYDLTDDELEVMSQVEEGMAAAMESAEAALPEGASEEDATAARYDAVMEYLQSKVEDGTIEALSGDEETGIISFVYTATGIGGAAQCAPFDTSSDPQASVDGTSNSSAVQQRMNAASEIELLTDDTGIDYVTYREKATILNYCAEDDPDEQDRVERYSWVADQLRSASFEVNEQYSVTVDSFKNLNGYQFIATDCHGSTYSHWGDKTPVICTDEEATSEAKKAYSADLKKGRIVAGFFKTNNKFWIRPDFFDFYYSTDKLDCSIFYLNVCKGAVDEGKALVNSIRNAGADSVVAYSDTVYTFYGTAMLSDIVDSLVKGNDIGQAVNAAKAENGENDHEWFQSVSSETPKPEIAVCDVYGSTSADIHDALVNGDFDSPFDILSDSISAWNEFGDARSVFKLAGIKPQSEQKMGVISSGFGSQNDETTSCIYQTILVPEDASTISFTYDVVSEEPMEYVNSVFNDTFDFEILNLDGEVLDTLATESVNDSTWYAVDGIDFPGGDETTFHTRWQSVTSDAISKYRSQLVVIRAIVRDAGDSIYDTAALIDSVEIN